MATGRVRVVDIYCLLLPTAGILSRPFSRISLAVSTPVVRRCD